MALLFDILLVAAVLALWRDLRSLERAYNDQVSAVSQVVAKELAAVQAVLDDLVECVEPEDDPDPGEHVRVVSTNGLHVARKLRVVAMDDAAEG